MNNKHSKKLMKEMWSSMIQSESSQNLQKTYYYNF